MYSKELMFAPADYDVNKIGFILLDQPDDSMDIDFELTPEITSQPPVMISAVSSRSTAVKADKTKNICHICHRVFMSRSNVRRHLNTVHSGKSLQCETCDVTFENQKLLSHHLNTFHKHTHTSDCVKFSCDKCGQELTTKEGMEKHLELHLKLVVDLDIDLDDLLGI